MTRGEAQTSTTGLAQVIRRAPAKSLLLLAVVALGGCHTPDVPEPQLAAMKWFAFTYVESGPAYARSWLEGPPTSTSQPDNEFEIGATDGRLEVVLDDRQVHVRGNQSHIWDSDPLWDVRKMLVADLDNDGLREAALTLWKPCTLEPSVVHNHFGFTPPCEEGTLRNHLFLYGWLDGEWRALWCSSPMADPIREMAVDDLDGDDQNEFVVLEGSYDDPTDEPARHVSVWRWNGWGFTLQWRSALGRYCNLILQDATSDRVSDVIVQDGC